MGCLAYDEEMLVLASRSPRRSAILRDAGIPFVVRPADVDETPQPAEPPREYVMRIAADKARAVTPAPDEIILGADTTVRIGSEMLAKPLDAADAARMLRLLSGQRHEVITGICLRHEAGQILDCASTSVWFADLSSREIEKYVATGEPMDKAGGYAIQGLASKFIRRIDGCYFNIVGLPVSLVYRYLLRF